MKEEARERENWEISEVEVISDIMSYCRQLVTWLYLSAIFISIKELYQEKRNCTILFSNLNVHFT